MTAPAPSRAQMVEEFRETKNDEPASSPPGYFDTVPDSHAFFPPKYATRGPTPSTAKSSERIKGVYSHDETLDRNPNELWRFLVSNLRPPRMAVHVSGTHTETRTTGTGKDTSTSSTTVTDFSVQIDVSKYVVPQWSRIVAHPSKGQAMTPTVRETLDEYTSSANPFKELRLAKLVLWDVERVTQLLTDLVRSTGYGKKGGLQTIRVQFPMQDYKVVALASNRYSRAAHNKLVRVLCVVSCLCVVFWPAWALARKRMKNRLACEYGMAISADEFFSRNSASVHSAVVQRSRSRELLVAL